MELSRPTEQAVSPPETEGKQAHRAGSAGAAHPGHSYLNPSGGRAADSAVVANPPLITPFGVKSEQGGWQQCHQQRFGRADYAPSTSVTASVHTKTFQFPTSLQVGSQDTRLTDVGIGTLAC